MQVAFGERQSMSIGETTLAVKTVEVADHVRTAREGRLCRTF